MRSSHHKITALAAVVSLALLSFASLACGGNDTTATGGAGTTPTSTYTYTYAQPPMFKATDFTQSSVCGGCHSEIYNQWQGAMMNNSLSDRFYQGVWEEQSHDTGGKYDFFCVACHSPIGSDSREAPPPFGPQLSPVTQEGIQCDFCHTLTSPDAYAPGPLKTGPFTDSQSSFHQSAYFELSTRSEFCGLCHDMAHPDNPVQLQSTYTEWKNSQYAAEGIQCQDCHMTPGAGVTKPNPGQAAIGGPERPHIYTHDFAGGNATALAGPSHQQLARRNLEAAASVLLSAPTPAVPGAQLGLNVAITNKGAGHSIPTGATELREMWLEVTVTDGRGDIIYRSGGLDEQGELSPQTLQYHTQFQDKDGNPTDKPWDAAGILSDSRIPARASILETFQVAVPSTATPPFTARAVLRYRSASPALVASLPGPVSLELPIIDMAQDQKTV